MTDPLPEGLSQEDPAELKGTRRYQDQGPEPSVTKNRLEPEATPDEPLTLAASFVPGKAWSSAPPTPCTTSEDWNEIALENEATDLLLDSQRVIPWKETHRYPQRTGSSPHSKSLPWLLPRSQSRKDPPWTRTRSKTVSDASVARRHVPSFSGMDIGVGDSSVHASLYPATPSSTVYHGPIAPTPGQEFVTLPLPIGTLEDARSRLAALDRLAKDAIAEALTLIQSAIAATKQGLASSRHAELVLQSALCIYDDPETRQSDHGPYPSLHQHGDEYAGGMQSGMDFSLTLEGSFSSSTSASHHLSTLEEPVPTEVKPSTTIAVGHAFQGNDSLAADSLSLLLSEPTAMVGQCNYLVGPNVIMEGMSPKCPPLAGSTSTDETARERDKGDEDGFSVQDFQNLAIQPSALDDFGLTPTTPFTATDDLLTESLSCVDRAISLDSLRQAREQQLQQLDQQHRQLRQLNGWAYRREEGHQHQEMIMISYIEQASDTPPSPPLPPLPTPLPLALQRRPLDPALVYRVQEDVATIFHQTMKVCELSQAINRQASEAFERSMQAIQHAQHIRSHIQPALSS